MHQHMIKYNVVGYVTNKLNPSEQSGLDVCVSSGIFTGGVLGPMLARWPVLGTLGLCGAL